LVVRKRARHQLEVRAVFVGQNGVPHFAGRAIAPLEEFLAGNDVMIRDVDDAGLASMIVTAEEILLRIPREEGNR
jgi:hypothetical protein